MPLSQRKSSRARDYGILIVFSARQFSAFLLLFGCFTCAAFSQRSNLDPMRTVTDLATSYETAPGTGVLIFKLFSERSRAHLDRQAVLKLVNLADNSTLWQTSDGGSHGVFTNIAYGNYAIEVSAVGYLSARKEIRVVNSLAPLETEMVLDRDPSAVNLDLADAIMSPKARKQAKHAISLLKSGKLAQAQQLLDRAHQLAPESPDINFLLGYLYFQKKDFTQAGTYLGTAATLNPHHGQALALLGRTGLERKDYPAARSALEQAVLADEDNWMPHNLLADAYLHQQNYDQAHHEAELAINKGKVLAAPAQLVLGESLAGLGRDQEAMQALNTFVQQAPHDPMAGQVQGLIAEIKNHSSGSPDESTSISEAHISSIDPLAAVPAPGLSMKSWHPAGVDEIKPAVAPDVACPSDHVIEESAKRVEEFVQDIARFAAVEDLFHQALDNYGIPIRTQTRKYNYVAAISESKPGSLSVDEYRAAKLDVNGFPDHIASLGFAAMALVFHPHMRDTFAMICEGLGDWKGQASWLVHFQQRDDRPNRLHTYKIGTQIYPVALKGRAWITADKFQIARIESDMVEPMPGIQLLSEHQVVEYGPVPFPKKNTALWLPKSAEIFFDFRKHRYYRRHSFDHYMLYSVETDERRKEPGAPAVNKN
jgi:tetratricopeptide (TPR) repeat protein